MCETNHCISRVHCRATKCSIYNMLSRGAYCVPYIHNILILKSGAYCVGHVSYLHNILPSWGTRSCSGRMLDQRLRDCGFERHLKHCVVFFSMTLCPLLGTAPLPRWSQRDIVLALCVRPSFCPLILPEPYLSTYWSELMHSWYKWIVPWTILYHISFLKTNALTLELLPLTKYRQL